MLNQPHTNTPPRSQLLNKKQSQFHCNRHAVIETSHDDDGRIFLPIQTARVSSIRLLVRSHFHEHSGCSGCGVVERHERSNTRQPTNQPVELICGFACRRSNCASSESADAVCAVHEMITPRCYYALLSDHFAIGCSRAVGGFAQQCELAHRFAYYSM